MKNKNAHFRLTSVAQKRCCLNSLLFVAFEWEKDHALIQISSRSVKAHTKMRTTKGTKPTSSLCSIKRLATPKLHSTSQGSGAPNVVFVLNTLKTLFRLSRELLDLEKFILSGAINFVSVRSSFWRTRVFSKMHGLQHYFTDNFICNLTYYD